MSGEGTTTQALRQAAGQMLSENKVGVIIGYGRNGDASCATPVFIRQADDVDRLVFDDCCFGNLAVYLSKSEVRALGTIGIVVKGCDLRAVNVLLRENVIQREDVVLIGVRCDGVGDPRQDKCAVCESRDPQGCDVVVGELADAPAPDAAGRYADVEAMDTKPLAERWEFWRGQLSKCIRCYACRQVCPLCYCKRCVVEKSTPQWVETSAHLQGNLAWNAVRAFHLTGRCVGCGECERVCPMHLPLGLVNQKMAKLVDEWFGDFRSGMAPDEEAPFTTFSADDPEDGIL